MKIEITPGPWVLDTTDTGHPRRSETKEEVEAWMKRERESRFTFEQKINDALRKAGVLPEPPEGE